MTRRLPLALLLVFAACDTAGDPAVDAERPTPISPAAFTLAAFPDTEGAARSAAGLNFLTAASRVGVVTTVVGLNLVLPHAATVAATRATPTVTDGTWTWASTVDVLGTPVDVRLDGTQAGSAIAWRLTTNRSGDAPFTFTTASTGLGGQTGAWELFNPDVSGAVLTADFDVRGDDTVTFRIPAGRERGGSSVRYETAGRMQRFDWTAQPENARTNVEWNLDTGAGWIEASDVAGGARACWDAQRRDTVCL